jgi:hypothetical protein
MLIPLTIVNHNFVCSTARSDSNSNSKQRTYATYSKNSVPAHMQNQHQPVCIRSALDRIGIGLCQDTRQRVRRVVISICNLGTTLAANAALDSHYITVAVAEAGGLSTSQQAQASSKVQTTLAWDHWTLWLSALPQLLAQEANQRNTSPTRNPAMPPRQNQKAQP